MSIGPLAYVWIVIVCMILGLVVVGTLLDMYAVDPDERKLARCTPKQYRPILEEDGERNFKRWRSFYVVKGGCTILARLLSLCLLTPLHFLLSFHVSLSPYPSLLTLSSQPVFDL